MTSVVALTAFSGCAGSSEPPLTEEQRRLNLESFNRVWTVIRDRHFDPQLGGVDWDAARDEFRPRMELVATMSGARRVLNEMLDRLGHTHVGVFPGEALTTGEEGRPTESDGVPGLEVRVIDGKALVSSVWDRFPAAAAGVRPGWRLERVGRQRVAPLLASVGRESAGKSHAEVDQTLAVGALLHGPVGGKLHVRFRDVEEQVVKLDLDLVEPRGERFQAGLLPAEWAWIDTRRIAGDVGYIAFNSFAYPTHVMQSFNEAMESFLDADGLIIDLRGNTGGLGGMCLWMAGWLISEKGLSLGTVVMRDNELRLAVIPRATTFDGPVAILIDGVSASASEVLSGGLGGLGRARLFGTRTAGASLPAELERLPNGDVLIYPTSRHLTPDGEPVEGRGVSPDVEAPLTREALIEGRDPALEAALGWIRESPTSNDKDEVQWVTVND
jgi:carboxyl-terminal processing protease